MPRSGRTSALILASAPRPSEVVASDGGGSFDEAAASSASLVLLESTCPGLEACDDAGEEAGLQLCRLVLAWADTTWLLLLDRGGGAPGKLGR